MADVGSGEYFDANDVDDSDKKLVINIMTIMMTIDVARVLIISRCCYCCCCCC